MDSNNRAAPAAPPAMIPTFVHQVDCRANEYRDNDMCDCDPVQVTR